MTSHCVGRVQTTEESKSRITKKNKKVRCDLRRQGRWRERRGHQLGYYWHDNAVCLLRCALWLNDTPPRQKFLNK